VIGIALDALELGTTIYDDLTDADKKLGKKTVSTAASIGGLWGGSLGGAKLGAMGGAAAGTFLIPLPGAGTAIGAVCLQSAAGVKRDGASIIEVFYIIGFGVGQQFRQA